jgi:hypothetical protein
MILAIDVYYRDKGAKAVGVLFEWYDATPRQTIIEGWERYKTKKPSQFIIETASFLYSSG